MANIDDILARLDALEKAMKLHDDQISALFKLHKAQINLNSSILRVLNSTISNYESN